MKRLGLMLAVGALVIGVALPAMAQQVSTANVNITFGGELRVAGIAFNNLTDFTDTTKSPTGGNPTFKDSNAWFHERFRLFTTIQSADKKARVYWAAEIGDLTWGSGGGASGAEYGGTSTRVGPSSGAGLGNDGVAVETKNLYTWFEIPGVPQASLLFGIHNIVFLSHPVGAFMDDDAAGIQFNFKTDPVDLQIWYAKADENSRVDADDNELWAIRLGINATKDLRFTVEGLAVNAQCFTRRLVTPAVGVVAVVDGVVTIVPAPTTATGTCVSADFGDTYWIGGTAAAKIGTVNLDGVFVYGKRALYSATLDKNIEESGWGARLTARAPLGPVSTWFDFWYTSGDKNRIVGTAASAAAAPGTGQDFSTASNSTRLNTDSDKLPVPIAGASWLGSPFVGEELMNSRTTGNISKGQPLYNDPTGTWGVGGSGTYAITPAVSVGGGVAYIAATEDNGIFGDNVIEVDAGALYQYNPNLSMQLVGAYLFPDKGDNAWSVIWRTRFAF